MYVKMLLAAGLTKNSLKALLSTMASVRDLQLIAKLFTFMTIE